VCCVCCVCGVCGVCGVCVSEKERARGKSWLPTKWDNIVLQGRQFVLHYRWIHTAIAPIFPLFYIKIWFIFNHQLIFNYVLDKQVIDMLSTDNKPKFNNFTSEAFARQGYSLIGPHKLIRSIDVFTVFPQPKLFEFRCKKSRTTNYFS